MKKKTKRQAMIYIAIHRKLYIEQHEPKLVLCDPFPVWVKWQWICRKMLLNMIPDWWWCKKIKLDSVNKRQSYSCTGVTRRVTPVEQELRTFPKHLSSASVFSCVLYFSVWCYADHCLSFRPFLLAHCIIRPLTSENAFSYLYAFHRTEARWFPIKHIDSTTK